MLYLRFASWVSINANFSWFLAHSRSNALIRPSADFKRRAFLVLVHATTHNECSFSIYSKHHYCSSTSSPPTSSTASTKSGSSKTTASPATATRAAATVASNFNGSYRQPESNSNPKPGLFRCYCYCSCCPHNPANNPYATASRLQYICFSSAYRRVVARSAHGVSVPNCPCYHYD